MASSALSSTESSEKAVLISNIPPSVTDARQLTSFIADKIQGVNVVECHLQPSVRYARVVLSSVDHAKLVLTLNGINWMGQILKVQHWALKFQPPTTQQPATKSCSSSMLSQQQHPTGDPPLSNRSDNTLPATERVSSVPNDNNKIKAITVENGNTTKPLSPPSKHRFHVQQAECAVFIRKIPHSVSSEELKSFVQKRIQLAFKELTEDIVILSCHIICKGDGSLNQACMEFSHQRIAGYALNLRTKTLHGQPLDILAWEDRSSSSNHQQSTTHVSPSSPVALLVEDQSSLSSSSDELSGGPNPSHRLGSDFSKSSCKQSYAVYVGNLPDDTTADKLSKFLIEMFLVAYKDPPTIIRCSIRGSPHNDAYVEFETQEQVNRAIYLRNRTLGGRKIAIVGWDHTFKIHNTKGFQCQVPERTAMTTTTTESRDDNGMDNSVPLVTDPVVVPPTKVQDKGRVDDELESTGLASILNKSFFDINNLQTSDMSSFPFPPPVPQPTDKSDVPVQESSFLVAASSLNDGSSALNAGIAIFKRQLDAARLENQGLKQRIHESAQSIVQLEELRIDRDEWKAACMDAHSKLEKTTAELVSCRTLKEQLDSEVAKLIDQLDTTFSFDSSKKRKSNELASIHDDYAAVTELQGRLADTEQRFKAVTETLTKQSMTVHETVEENRKLRASLEQERALRIKAEQEITDLRSSIKKC
jgi:RNA recognition motif. (a.k.a. RRM, RBD, or RNP domain)